MVFGGKARQIRNRSVGTIDDRVQPAVVDREVSVRRGFEESVYRNIGEMFRIENQIFAQRCYSSLVT
jgi:hypothetical protein